MKKFLFGMGMLTLLLSGNVYGQALSGLSYGLRAKFRQPQPFSYPRKTQAVVYKLNGKQTTDGDYVKRVLSRENIVADTLLIGLPGRNGTREIVINYKQLPAVPATRSDQ